MQLVMSAIHWMCVRVIISVVNYRLDYKQFVLRYCSVPKLTVQGVVCAERSLVFVIR